MSIESLTWEYGHAGQFEVPLLDEFDSHRAVVAERQLAYEQATLAKTKLIRETEAKNIKVRMHASLRNAAALLNMLLLQSGRKKQRGRRAIPQQACLS